MFQEFIPRGRKVVDQHPGPLTKRNEKNPSEFVLLDRMQNVNLSKDEHFNESWKIRDVFEHSSVSEELAFLTPASASSEEELYFRGNTAVWSSGLSDAEHEKASSETCYTSESPIQFAFFCTKSFLDADYKVGSKQRSTISSAPQGIGVIDTNSLKVYSSDGENLMSAVEPPISKIWITKYCIIVDKEASSSIVDGHALSMPRVFSLVHPLDDMFPMLIKSSLLVNYITEAEYKVRRLNNPRLFRS